MKKLISIFSILAFILLAITECQNKPNNPLAPPTQKTAVVSIHTNDTEIGGASYLGTGALTAGYRVPYASYGIDVSSVVTSTNFSVTTCFTGLNPALQMTNYTVSKWAKQVWVNTHGSSVEYNAYGNAWFTMYVREIKSVTNWQ